MRPGSIDNIFYATRRRQARLLFACSKEWATPLKKKRSQEDLNDTPLSKQAYAVPAT